MQQVSRLAAAFARARKERRVALMPFMTVGYPDLGTSIELVKAMGIVYNPHFYLTIEDWQFEHAADSLGELEDLF